MWCGVCSQQRPGGPTFGRNTLHFKTDKHLGVKIEKYVAFEDVAFKHNMSQKIFHLNEAIANLMEEHHSIHQKTHVLFELKIEFPSKLLCVVPLIITALI